MASELYFKLKKRFSTINTPVVSNVNKVEESKYSKRALLIYLVNAFLVDVDDPLFYFHHNMRRCRNIAMILDELGYIVDVADGGDPRFKPALGYDLILSDRADLKGRHVYFGRNATKIFIATTDYHAAHNESLRRRLAQLSKRRSCEVRPRRMYSESMSYVTDCNAIAAVGNEFNAGSWREVFNGPIFPFNNCGFKETSPPVESKDSQHTKLNFLFFAGGCQVQKGLDLLLEIFPKYPHLRLYVCSPFEQENDFCDCYYNELYKTPNVHPVGWVQVNSPHFYELTDKCAFVILPSCSEGQPSSVVQCMHSGLIPLVTKQAGIDTEDFGVTFSDDSIEEIERAILEVSELPASWISARSAHTFGAAKEKFSEDAFVDRWRKMLSEILDLRAQTHL